MVGGGLKEKGRAVRGQVLAYVLCEWGVGVAVRRVLTGTRKRRPVASAAPTARTGCYVPFR